MAKKNKKKHRGSSLFVIPVPGWVTEQIEDLLAEDRPKEAIELIEKWREKRQNHPALAFYLGSAYLMLDEHAKALQYLRLARRLDPRNEAALNNLFSTYLELGYFSQGLRALKEFMRTELAREEKDMEVLSALRAGLERNNADAAAYFGVPLDKYEEASLWNEEGQIAQHEGDWEQAVAALSRALGCLPEFTPALNNRAMSYFFMGRLEEAIADEQQVIAKDPENIHALANLVRYHYVRGESRRMQDCFERLRALPETAWEHQFEPIPKMLEAYAVAGADEEIRAFCEKHQESLSARGHYMLGAAAANLGKRREARRIWVKMEEDEMGWKNLAEDALQELEDGYPGLGRASRFPYTAAHEWMSSQQLEMMIETIQGYAGDPENQRRAMEKIISQHPAIFEAINWLLWHGNDPKPAIHMLGMLGTERAFGELKRFALGQAGEDEERMSAVMVLNDQGQFPEGQPVRLWHQGEWRDLLLKKFEITDEPEDRKYRPEVHQLLGQAGEAMQEKRLDQAEEIYQRILGLDPECCAAYNNLANIRSIQGDQVGMRQYIEKSLEINPDYPNGRCNLALLYLKEGRLEEAENLVTPLLERRQFAEFELKVYNIVMAHLHLHRGNLEAVETAVKFLREQSPEDPLVQQLADALAEQKRKG